MKTAHIVDLSHTQHEWGAPLKVTTYHNTKIEDPTNNKGEHNVPLYHSGFRGLKTSSTVGLSSYKYTKKVTLYWTKTKFVLKKIVWRKKGDEGRKKKLCGLKKVNILFKFPYDHQ